MFPALPSLTTHFGHVVSGTGQTILVQGLQGLAGIGARVRLGGGTIDVEGEIISETETGQQVALYGSGRGVCSGMPVEWTQENTLCPGPDWLGKVLDHEGLDADGRPPAPGDQLADLHRSPPAAGRRRDLGPRLHTGLSAIDTFLPICRGQRIGLFAGSGVGKTSLLGKLATQSDADINVIALIGERGREVRAFVDSVLGPEAMKRSIVFAATSDQPPAIKLRTARLAIATAEIFRDKGQHVLFLFDSLTRFAQAHREVSLTAGETPALQAFPPSTFPALAKICERAGPGVDDCAGDITAVFSVLVQGSDMEEPVADTVRGILDGHIILDRGIAEGGRYPAIDVGRSVSRSLPAAASEDENKVLEKARALLRRYEDGRLMVQSGLYTAGGDPLLDAAVAIQPALDLILREGSSPDFATSFASLQTALRGVGQQ